jgi:DNA-binding NarL/FixJ family response regulator
MPIAVLIVDDDPAFRETSSELLRRQGLHVAGQAEDAAAARRLAALNEVDAALVDVHLPDGNGVALAGELTDRHPGLRILLTSSDPSAADLIEVRESGAAGFVAKTDLAATDLSGLFSP